jgi:hypothetical protein
MPANNRANSLHHVLKIKEMLIEASEHAKQDVSKVEDPKAQALFETTAEVLKGLATAYDHFETGTETAWKETVAGSQR